jgi:hypothetical protein
VVFALLVLATFTAFFVAQALKRTDPLVYAVQMKKYVSPNGDGLREKARLRFRTKKADVVTVEVIDRAGNPVRTLADEQPLTAGPHRFLWSGRIRLRGRNRGAPAPDGAYRVRISMRRSGRTFVPDKFFVVDTSPPRLRASVIGDHIVQAGRGRPGSIRLEYSGIEASRRVEFRVYRVRGNSTASRPVAAFASDRGKATGHWDLTTGVFRQRHEPCFGQLETRGRPRPAPPGSYVVVARGCDAAGNTGSSSRALPPRRGAIRGDSGITLRGVEIAPPQLPLTPRTNATFTVNPPAGRYRWSLRSGNATVARGTARGSRLRMRVPRTEDGLYEVRVIAKRRTPGLNRAGSAPVVIRGRGRPALLAVYPSIAWQVSNPVDLDGDGFGDGFDQLGTTRERRVPVDRTLAGGRLPRGFATAEGAVAQFLAGAVHRSTTDFALAANPDAALRGVKGVIFTGAERWITPQLGVALRRFVERGGRVAFFGSDAFRRTVRVTGNSITGPSDRADRDIFGESVTRSVVAPAPVVAFADSLGLLRGPTGLFTVFEQSRSRVRSAQTLTAAGREPGRPALIAYRLGKGLVIRVGVEGWQTALRPGTRNVGVAFTTAKILEELTR